MYLVELLQITVSPITWLLHTHHQRSFGSAILHTSYFILTHTPIQVLDAVGYTSYSSTKAFELGYTSFILILISNILHVLHTNHPQHLPTHRQLPLSARSVAGPEPPLQRSLRKLPSPRPGCSREIRSSDAEGRSGEKRVEGSRWMETWWVLMGADVVLRFTHWREDSFTPWVLIVVVYT